jgi:hypothetical protein
MYAKVQWLQTVGSRKGRAPVERLLKLIIWVEE